MTDRTFFNGPRIASSVLCALFLLASCGGGVDSGGTGAPVSLAAGPITGLGSIIVNGVRFDVGSARIVDQDDQPLTADQLHVGMGARVDATAIQVSGGQSTATGLTIRTSSEIVGPVDSVGTLGATLVVLGQPVRITAATWVDGSVAAGIGALAPGQVVEVWGQYNPRSGEYVATRVSSRAGAAAYELRGLLASIDSMHQTLVVGGLTIGIAGVSASALPTLTIGRFLRLTLNPVPVDGVWTATAVSPGNAALPDRADARVAGRISSLTSTTQFVVNGVSVDATGAAFSDGGSGLVLGARVVVAGAASGGVIVATTVTVEGDETLANSTFETHGVVAQLDTATEQFQVHGITVRYTAQVPLTGGTLANLANGTSIDVVGTLASDRMSIDAQSIGFR